MLFGKASDNGRISFLSSTSRIQWLHDVILYIVDLPRSSLNYCLLVFSFRRLSSIVFLLYMFWHLPALSLGESRDLLQREELFANVTSVSELNERLERADNERAFFLDVEDLVLEQPIVLNVPNVTLRGWGTSQTTLTCADQGPGNVLIIRQDLFTES